MTEDNLKLADLLFPKPLPTPEELEAKYPARQLPEGTMVTRVAPSPTGFMHIGTVYTALICYKLARQTNGVFFLRLEDTDKKREVEGANQLIIRWLEEFGIIADEGPTLDGEKGAYGPYIQSQRETLYHTFAKKLVAEGKAYACFCTPEELEAITTKQSQMKLKPGYYKDWAVWRNKPLAEVEKALAEGKKPVIRFRNEGNSVKRNKIEDLIKGKSELPEDEADIVLIKSDGLPTYHFAHIVDDHLMRTTHVIRGDEWFASLPLHLQLFRAMEWKAPKYAHIAPIQKLDEGNRRKLSKRKDPEAGVTYYFDEGYPVGGIIEYLLTVADSSFEPWRRQNPAADLTSYELKIKNIGSSGALLDFKKMDNVCTGFIGKLSPDQTYDLALAWAKEHDNELAELMLDRPYWLEIFGLERDNPNQRKDLRFLSTYRNLPVKNSWPFTTRLMIKKPG
jgi:glutamyl-tRNA synthetase